MKKRLWFSLIISILVFSGLFLAFFLGTTEHQRIMGAISMIWIVYFAILFFAGIPKLLVAIIYGLLTLILLYFFPQYNLAIILIVSILFVLNPLSELETHFEKYYSNEGTFLSNLTGSYQPFYEYRREVKNYYHLPQARKLHTKPRYVRRRQTVVILMSVLAVVLLIREIDKLMRILTQPFSIYSFFGSTYTVTLLIVLTVILYRKGFQSMLNVLTVSIFPPVAYTIFLTVKPYSLAIGLGITFVLLGVAVAVIEYINYMRRVVYEYYHYYDNSKQEEVYANALFEPFVYNDYFYLSSKYTIKTEIHKFQKEFQSILVYSNFKRFFITAYTYNRRKKEVTIYTEFHYRDDKKVDKFNTYLESIFEDSISYQIVEDKDRVLYEKNFFHNDDYIVARTIYLAELLKTLEIKGNVIISLVAYFKDIENIITLSKSYSVTRIPSLDLEGVLTARIDAKVNNVDYLIEEKVRQILIELLVYQGKYIRVSVYY